MLTCGGSAVLMCCWLLGDNCDWITWKLGHVDLWWECSIDVSCCVWQLACYDQIKVLLMKTGFFQDNMVLHLTCSTMAVSGFQCLTHMCMHTYSHIHAHTLTCAHTHTCTHTHACTRMHACVHAHTHRHAHACACAHTHALTHTWMHACMCACTGTPTDIHMHARAHTHTHIWGVMGMRDVLSAKI